MSENILYLVVGVLILAVIGAVGFHFLMPGAAGAGDTVPNFVLSEHGGETKELISFRGSAVILFVLKSDCDTCVKQLSALGRLNDHFGKRGLAVLAVLIDSDPAAADAMITNYEGSLTVLEDPDGRAMKKALGIDGRSLPVAFLLDPSGRVVERYDGFVSWRGREMRELIGKILPPPPAPAAEPEVEAEAS